MGSVRQKAPRQGLRSSPGLRRARRAPCNVALLGRAALVDGRERQAAGQAAGGGAGIHPGEFEGHQGQRQVLGALDEAALGGIHEDAGDAGFVEGLQQRLLLGRPVVRVARARRHQAGDRSARHGADGLHQHLEIVTVGEAPQDLADIVAGQGA